MKAYVLVRSQLRAAHHQPAASPPIQRTDPPTRLLNLTYAPALDL